MPEASARSLRDDDRRAEPSARSLRLVAAPESLGRSSAGEASSSLGERPGRPHPRSRIRPEHAAGTEILEANAARAAAAAAPRTIVVTGQRPPATASPEHRGVERRRSSPGTGRAVERPDRLALWAVGLGLVLAFMAAATAQAATSSPPTGTTPVVAHR